MSSYPQKLLKQAAKGCLWSQLGVKPGSTGVVFGALCRSNVFGISTHKEPRDGLKEREIHSQNGYSIKYSGPVLTQYDLDTLWAVIYFCLPFPPGDEVEVKITDLARILKKPEGGLQRKSLIDSVVRLAKVNIQVDSPMTCGNSRHFIGHIIDSAEWDGRHKTLIIRVSSSLHLLREITFLDISIRRQLSKDLSKWLQAYIHACGRRFFSTYDDTLQQLCGSVMSRRRDFRRKLKEALEELMKTGFILQYSINPKGKVSIKRHTGKQHTGGGCHAIRNHD